MHRVVHEGVRSSNDRRCLAVHFDQCTGDGLAVSSCHVLRVCGDLARLTACGEVLLALRGSHLQARAASVPSLAAATTTARTAPSVPIASEKIFPVGAFGNLVGNLGGNHVGNLVGNLSGNGDLPSTVMTRELSGHVDRPT